MGTWNTSISGNDEFMSVYETFKGLYAEYDGKKWLYDLDILKSKMQEQFAEKLNDKDTADEYWFAMAKAFWDYGIKDDSAYLKTQEIINSGSNLEVWKSLDATEKQLKERQKELAKFLEKLSVEKGKPNQRPKQVNILPAFAAGELLAIKSEDGHYCAGVVSGASTDKWGRNVIHLLNYYSKEKPSADTILHLDLMTHDLESTTFTTDAWGNRRPNNIYGFLLNENGFKKTSSQIEKVGEMEFHNHGFFKDGLKSFGDFSKHTWDVLPHMASLNYKSTQSETYKPLLYYYSTGLQIGEKEYATIIDSIKKRQPFKIFSQAFPAGMYGSVHKASTGKTIWAAITIEGFLSMNQYLVPNILKRFLAIWLERNGLVLDDYWFSVSEYEGESNKSMQYQIELDEAMMVIENTLGKKK
jgi:hypothetical protein